MTNEKVEGRWFVSSYGELTMVMSPEDYTVIRGRDVKVKAHRLIFVKSVRPRQLRGQGHLGNGPESQGATDLNISPYWSVFYTEDREEIDFLRAHAMYKMTNQDNRLQHHMKLKELDWDPNGLPKATTNLVRQGANAVVVQAPTPEPPAAETSAEKPKARMGVKNL